MESLTFYSTKASISVSTAAGMKSSKLFLRRFGRKLVEVFFHGSYFYGIYFHERLDGSFHESFHEEAASRIRMLPSNLPFKTFDGNGSRSFFRGNIHGSSFHGRFRGSRGYRSTSPSPPLRQQGPSRESSAIHHPWPTPMEEVRANSGAHSRATKYQTRTHGPTRTFFHCNFYKCCTACTAA